MLASVASDDAQKLGLLVSIEASVFAAQLDPARVTISIDSICTLVDLQRERCPGRTECISESNDMATTTTIGGGKVALALGGLPEVIG